MLYRSVVRPCWCTCALLAGCLGPSPPPCAMHVPVSQSAALLLQSATEHLFPPPWAMHLPVEPTEPLPQPSSSQRSPPPCEMHLPDEPFAPLGQPG